MNRLTTVCVAVLAGILILIVALFVFDIGGSKIFASPEDVFDASKAALKQNDLRTWCDCLTEESRDLLAASEIIYVMTLKTAPPQFTKEEHKAQIKAAEPVLKSHGLTDAFLTERQGALEVFRDERASPDDRLQVAQALLKPVNDRNAFFEQLQKALSSGSKSQNPFEQWKDAKLTNVKIRGNEALGTVVFKESGQAREQPLHFKKVRESWKIDMLPIPNEPGM
jgi:hypothetical protein